MTKSELVSVIRMVKFELKTGAKVADKCPDFQGPLADYLKALYRGKCFEQATERVLERLKEVDTTPDIGSFP